MNIILVSPLPPPAGGIASWTQHYLDSQEDTDNKVVVVNSSVTGKRVNHIAKRKLKDEINRVFRIKKEIDNLLRNDKYDVLHYNSSGSTLGMIKDYICLRQTKKKVKIILHFHCDTAHMVKGLISEYIFIKLCKLSDKILCLNTSSKDHINKLSETNGIIIPNFIVSHNNEKRIISNEIKTIIFVGHVTPLKGYYEFLKVAEEYPDIKFKLIGACNDNYRNSRYSNVEFTGEVSKQQVIRELKLADLLLFPSHTEGFPLAVLEAMSCGLPIVATRVGAIYDMIEDKGGRVVDIGDIDSMVKAIEELQCKNTRKIMSDWNINKVLSSYTMDIVIKNIFKIYGE